MSDNIDWQTLRKTLWTGTQGSADPSSITLSEAVSHFDAVEFTYGLTNWNVGPNTTDCATVVTPNPIHSNRVRAFLTIVYGYSSNTQELRSGVVQVSSSDGVTLSWDVPRSIKTTFTGTSATTVGANGSDSSTRLTLVRVTGLKYA